MAKVYSWEISKNPTKYAYIVNPIKLDEAYIGYELKGNNLEIIKEWTSNCTDDEYKEQFQKLITLCKNKGYNVNFETVEVYLNVNSNCDNLRGPAGKGITKIVQKGSLIDNISVYTIIFDDNTTYDFEVINGINGKDGENGKPGRDGERGVTSKFVMIYSSGKDGIPETPKGGSYNFYTNELIYPNGWTSNDNNITPPVFMSTGTFKDSDIDIETGISINVLWDAPIQITGEQGLPGVDGMSIEFIYILTNTQPDVKNLDNDKTVNGYVPKGWTGSPSGVSENNTTEYCSIRKYSEDKKEWGDWEEATIWSKYGINGQDGDGVQYIYFKSKTGEPPSNPTPKNYKNSENYQDKNSEWIPPKETYENIEDKNIEYLPEYNSNGEIIGNIWTDNPTDVNINFPYQWVSTRKYRDVNGRKEWTSFSNPALWGKYGEKGKSATIIRKLYYLGKSTSDVPTPPVDSINTGEWSTFFPVDYVAGIDVVWGVEGELNADDLSFVEGYVVISTRNENNEVIPPKDYEGNYIEVDTIPQIKYENIKYLLFNGEYYQWKGGWSNPFIVSGIKGENGNPIDYTTFVFGYGYYNSIPGKPNSGDIKNLGYSTDGNGKIVQWYDFPDISDGKTENAPDNEGNIRRWYQCCGQVEGETNTIKKDENGELLWGEVYPCNAQDGKTTEIRLAVTKNTSKPNFSEEESKEREPKLYDNSGEKIGWFSLTDENIPEIPSNGAMWQIYAVINPANNELMSSWSQPIRISGEKGDQGEPGPAGRPGVSGIPGASFILKYCLGTENIYFGDTNFENNDLINRYFSENIPSTQIIKFDVIDENYNNFITNENNKGCVIKVKEGDVYNYKLIDYENKINDLIDKNGLPIKIENDFLYLWCIQGTEKWIRNNPDTDEDDTYNIIWGKPFKLQGSNGLRGLNGKRGQVVYPMGVYNQEEVYITTENKAPYVYDPNDGQFYVLNIVNQPWVGKLPENYQTIKKEDGTFKYSLSGLEDGPWMTDQKGQTPAGNYTENKANEEISAWVKFESFQALYTSIGIIANGMIGSAVYNNEFMFSQQGCDSEGNESNFAFEYEKNGGFLSAYEYDEIGEIDENGEYTGRHWKLDNTYIDDINVNPYLKDSTNDKYVHGFIPNICINFKTGQMWAARGQVYNGPTTSSLGDLSDLVNNFNSQTAENLNKLNSDINEIYNETNDVRNSLGILNDELSNSLEDGYLSKDEQVRIQDKLDDLEVQFKELSVEHTDLFENENIQNENIKNELEDVFDILEKSHNNFVDEIEKLLNVEFSDNAITYNMRAVNNDTFKIKNIKVNLNNYFTSGEFEENGLGWDYKYQGDWDWSIIPTKDKKPGFKDYQIKYENDLDSYLKKVLEVRNFIQSKLSEDIDKAIQTVEENINKNFAEEITKINGGLKELQQQVDGEVSSYFLIGAPVIIENDKDIVDITKEPLKDWLVNYDNKDNKIFSLKEGFQNELINNLGDTYTNTEKYSEQTPLGGKSWRWCDATDAISKNIVTKEECIKVEYSKDSQNISKFLHWHRTEDTDAIRALQLASEALSTVDGKSTIFISIDQEGDRVPNNYSIGDMWILNQIALENGEFNKEDFTDQNGIITTKYYYIENNNNIYITSGDILTANQSSEKYILAHWSKKVKYTDDSLAEEAKKVASDAKDKADAAQTDAQEAKEKLETYVTDKRIDATEMEFLKSELNEFEQEKIRIVGKDGNGGEASNWEASVSPTDYITAYDIVVRTIGYYTDVNSDEYKDNNYIRIIDNAEGDESYKNWSNLSNYYTQRQIILESIATASKKYSDEIKHIAEQTTKGQNLCVFKNINDNGFTYAQDLEKDGSFKIYHNLLYFESSDKSKDMFGINYIDNIQYTLSCYDVDSSKMNDDCELYFKIHYKDGSYESLNIEKSEVIKEYTITSNKDKSIEYILGGRLNSDDSDDTYIKCKIKLELGNSQTLYNIPIDDKIFLNQKEINELDLSIENAINTANSIDAKIDEAFADGSMNLTEQKAIKNSFNELIRSKSDMDNEYNDVYYSGYLDDSSVSINNEVYSKPKENIEDKKDKLDETFEIYKNLIYALINVKFEENSVSIKYDSITVEGSPLSAQRIDDALKNYTDDINNFKEALSVAQENIRINIQKGIEIGGKNLLIKSEFADYNINPYENSEITKTRNYNINSLKIKGTKYQITNGSNKIKGIINLFESNDKRNISNVLHTLSFYYKNNKDIKVNVRVKLSNSKLIENKANWYTDVVIKPNSEGRMIITGYLHEELNFQFQLFTDSVSNDIDIILARFQLEEGNKATSWKHNEEDIIEAHENILKESMMIVSDGTELIEKSLTTPLKSNTEYVFSVEKSNNNNVTISLIDENQNNPLTELIYTKNKSYILFTTPDYTNSKVYLYTNDISTILYGVKIAEGNKYVGWEGTSDEQKTLIMINNAMQGTTETNGGLILTNTIGMKGSSTDSNSITAGINGLIDENSNSPELRFWAGSNTWNDIETSPFRVYDDGSVYSTKLTVGMNGNGTMAGINSINSALPRFWAGSSNEANSVSAPFRVYDDGRVFGTHFYGFHSALPIMSTTTLSSYSKGNFKNGNYTIYIIDIRKTGSKILLGNLGSTIAISLPSAEYQNTNTSLESDLEYVGSEIEIYNPFGMKLHICGCDMPDPEYCNLYNMTTTYGETKPSTHNGYPSSNPVRWTMNRSTCSVSNGITYRYAKFKCIRHNISYDDFTTNIIGYNKFSNNGYYVILWVLVECIK